MSLLSASSNSSKNENGYMLWEDYSYVRLTQVGDSANAIEIQVWCVLIACLLMSVFRAANKIQKMSFSNMMFVVRRVLMEYVWLCAVMADSERTLTRMLSRQNRAHAPPSLFD